MNRSHMMQAAVQRYLEERHLLGFALKSPGTELMRFARFADSRGHQGPLTLDLQLDWAREHVARTGAVTAARRLEVVRPFAAHYRQFEPATEVPPPFILGRGHRRLAPHIYTEQEIGDLLDLSGRMTPPGGLRRPGAEFDANRARCVPVRRQACGDEPAGGLAGRRLAGHAVEPRLPATRMRAPAGQRTQRHAVGRRPLVGPEARGPVCRRLVQTALHLMSIHVRLAPVVEHPEARFSASRSNLKMR